MKRTFALVGLTVVAALILVTATQAQNNNTRVGTYALKGPASTMRVEEATMVKQDGKYVEGPRVLRMTVLFDEAGRRPELCLYNEKGSLARRIEMRFEAGRDAEFLNYDGAGRMWLRGVTLYDKQGRVKESATYNGDGSLRSKTTFTHNEKGAILEKSESGANGVLLERIVNTFDDAGKLKTSERAIYNPDGSLSLKVSTYMPDKRVESVSYNRDGSIAQRSVRIDKQINEFGPDGSLKKTIEITNPDRLTMESVHNPDGTLTKNSQVVDEVDSNGNWVKQTRWITDSQGTRPIKVTYREITYFGASGSQRPIN